MIQGLPTRALQAGRAVRSLGRWARLPVQALAGRPTGAVVLLYHRVGGGSGSDIDMPAALFERQMTYLSRHCRVVMLNALTEGQVSGDRDVVAITFDDGYVDTYEVAFPVLRRLGLPATIFIPTRYVDEQRPFDFGAFARLRGGAAPMPMGWAHLREMTATGLVTIGAHTHTHADLTRLSPLEIEQELDTADRLIESRLGVRPSHFAYPWGAWSPGAHAAVARRYQTVLLGGPAKNLFPLDPSRLWRMPVLRTDGYWLFLARLRTLSPPGEPDDRPV